MKIQLKRSNVLEGPNAKPPTAAQMEDGEIAVNYNTADPTLFIKDSAGGIVRINGNVELIAALQAEIDAIKLDIISINGSISDINDNIDDIESDVSDIVVRLNGIDGQIATIQGQISTINGQISAIQGDISTINGSISSINAEIASIKGDISTIEGEISTIQDVLPSPLTGSAHQDNTLDERYVSRFSWADLPTL